MNMPNICEGEHLLKTDFLLLAKSPPRKLYLHRFIKTLIDFETPYFSKFLHKLRTVSKKKVVLLGTVERRTRKLGFY